MNNAANCESINMNTKGVVKDRFLVEDVLREAAISAPFLDGRKNVQLISDISCNLPDTLIGDKEKLSLLLKNTLSGFCDGIADGGRITLRIRAAGTDDKERLVISFEIKSDGTAAELTAAEELVSLMDGTIGLNPAQDGGAGISIFIPFTQFPGASTIGQKCANPRFENLRALVVGGSPFERRMFNLFLASLRIKPWFAGGFEDAAEIVKSRMVEDIFFDLIIADLYGSEIEGINFTRKLLRILPREPKFLLLSPDSAEYAPMRKGIPAAFIKKPFVPSDLSAKISVALCSEAANIADDNEEAEGTTIFSGSRVLLVEDDPVNQIVISGILEMYGIKSDLAENGRVALQKLEAERFDLIVMDMLMPVMTGYEAAKNIRASVKSYKDVPIIAMTANVSEDEKKKCLSLGMNGFIAKPVEAKSLYSELLKALPANVSIEPAVIMTAPAYPAENRRSALRVEGVDVEDGLRRFVNKADRYKKALGSFAEELSGSLPALQSLVSGGELEKASALAHRIKGAAGNLGAKELYAAAFKLETSSKNDTCVLEALSKFRSCAEIVINGVRKALDNNADRDDSAKEMGTEDEAVTLLKSLSQSIGEFDPVSSERLLEELSGKEWAAFDSKALSEISALVEGYKYDEAGILIATLLRGRA